MKNKIGSRKLEARKNIAESDKLRANRMNILSASIRERRSLTDGEKQQISEIDWKINFHVNEARRHRLTSEICGDEYRMVK